MSIEDLVIIYRPRQAAPPPFMLSNILLFWQKNIHASIARNDMRDKFQPISVRQILPSVVARNSEADKLSVAAFHSELK
jgi:hypothetical protein